MERFTREYTGKFARRGSLDYIYRPLVEIEVLGKEQGFKFEALVDSGSEITIIDKDIATLLGVDEEDCPKSKIGGIGGDLDCFLHQVSLRVQGFNEVFTFNVAFVDDPEKNFDIILGQSDFFRNFNVSFEKRKGRWGVVTLER